MSNLYVRIVTLVAALLVALPAVAARVELGLDSSQLVLGQRTELRLTVVDGVPRGTPSGSVPAGLGLEFRHQSTQQTSINFRVTHTVIFHYELAAEAEGEYLVGPFTVDVEGVPLQSNVVRVRVGPRESMESGATMVADQSFGADEVWEGQVVLYRYRLRTRVQVMDPQWSLQGFDGLDRPRDGEPVRSRYVLQDEHGAIAVDETTVPFVAVEVGEHVQPAAVVRVPVAEARDPHAFDPFGLMTPVRNDVLTAEAVTLTVRARPPEPDGFSGLVGEVELTSAVERTDVAVGDAVELTVTVRGDVRLDGFDGPEVAAPDGLRAYPSAPAVGGGIQDGAYRSEGRYTWVLVPTQAGHMVVPPLQLVVFSPEAGRYVTLSAPGATLDVAPGEATDAALCSCEEVSAPVTPEDQGFVDQDVAPARAVGPGYVAPVDRFLPALLGLAAAPGLGVLALTVVGRVRKRFTPATAVPLTPLQRVCDLPSEPSARLAVLDGALTDALLHATGATERRDAIARLPVGSTVPAVVADLDRTRFGGEALNPDLEARVVAAVEELS